MFIHTMVYSDNGSLFSNKKGQATDMYDNTNELKKKPEFKQMYGLIHRRFLKMAKLWS